MASRNASRYPAPKPRATVPGTKTFKPRREFRAWLINELNCRGAQLPADATYVQLQHSVSVYLVPRP